MKKVNAKPISDRETNMDHLCFVDLFPSGIGRMYDNRATKIMPAKYIRWILNQSNPSARRHIQYLLSAIHNKDIRAIDSGIFEQVRSSKLPNMNVKSLKDGLEQKKNIRIKSI